MAASSSPTVRRRQLATELKRLRLAAKMTIEQVAEHLEWSPGKISKIENARVSVLPRDVRHLLEAYGIGEGPEREALLTLARQSRERGWWQQYGEAIPEYFQTYVGLEAAASTISTYQAEYVPGLLQTEAYATAVHRAALMNADEGEISKQVTVRMARQHRLTEPDAPQLWVVLNEAVIRRLVGERGVMQCPAGEAVGAIGCAERRHPDSSVLGGRASGDGLGFLRGDVRPADTGRRRVLRVPVRRSISRTSGRRCAL